MGLANTLKQLRKQSGLTQVQLAAKSGVSRGYLARLEAGLQADPGLRVVKKLAKALNVPAARLMN
jgi:transcriptional regulator with XRE-family HTH domain